MKQCLFVYSTLFALLLTSFLIIFTALRGMQKRSCDENSVRPSVNCDKTAERYV